MADIPDSMFDWKEVGTPPPPPAPACNPQTTAPTEHSERSHSIISGSLYSRSSSKCVSMPSAPGTEQMSLAFRKVLHLFTRQQWPPSSFCMREGGDTVRSSFPITQTHILLCRPTENKPRWSHPHTHYTVHVGLQSQEAKRMEGGGGLRW